MTVLDALIVVLSLSTILVGLLCSTAPEEDSPRATCGGTARGENTTNPNEREAA
jgi:hypothetical protein